MGSSSSGFSAWDNFWRMAGDAGKAASWSKRRIVGLISNYVKPGMDILDAGCGAGFFSSYFISRGCNVYSMDYSEEALCMAKDMTGNKSRMYISADILDGIGNYIPEDLSAYRPRDQEKSSNVSAERQIFLDMKFDIIFTDGLLEHYSKEKQDIIIRNMKGVKKEQGYIIDFAPNRFSLWSIVRPFVMDIEERPFVMREFIDLHERNSLSVISSGGINVLPFRISPEKLLARYFGMLFYCVAV